MSPIRHFKGHRITALISNAVFALFPYVSLLFLEYFFAIGSLWLVLVFGLVCILTFSHPTYLFFEIKHLIDRENIIEKVDASSIIVFGGLGLCGLALQIVTIIRLLTFFNPAVYVFSALLLSLVAAIGGCLGLTDLVSRRGLWPPTFVKHLEKIIQSKKLLTVCLGTTLLLFVLTLIFV